MVIKSYNNVPVVGLLDVAEQLPETVAGASLPGALKAPIIKATKDNCSRLLGACMVAGALTAGNPASALESPYEPLVDTSGKTVLVLKNNEEQKMKEELLKLFDAEDTALFNSLPSEEQKKTMSYFVAGKDKQPNVKKFYKGIANLMMYYHDIKINERALEQYKKTGKLPEDKIPTIGASADIAARGFPEGANYVDVEKASQFDKLITELMKNDLIEQEKQVAEGEKRVDALKKEKERLQKENASLQKDIDILQKLLKAL